MPKETPSLETGVHGENLEGLPRMWPCSLGENARKQQGFDMLCFLGPLGAEEAQQRMIKIKDVMKHFLQCDESEFELKVQKFHGDCTL